MLVVAQGADPALQKPGRLLPHPLRVPSYNGVFGARKQAPRLLLRPICAAEVIGTVKLALPAGKATPAPPVGPALGAKQVNIMQFCKEYNAATQSKAGSIIPVEITVYKDKTFTFVLKTPPTSTLLAKAAGVKKGSGTPNGAPVGYVTQEQIKEIAEIKLPDLNCRSVESAIRTVLGTARNMGIAVKEATSS